MAHTEIPALRKLRQEDSKFKASLGYLASLCLKTNACVAKGAVCEVKEETKMLQGIKTWFLPASGPKGQRREQILSWHVCTGQIKMAEQPGVAQQTHLHSGQVVWDREYVNWVEK